MQWIMRRIRRARNEAIGRAWFEEYGAHIADLERTIEFECPRCVDPDPEEDWPVSYPISSAVRLGFRCGNCRSFLRLVEID